MSAPKLTIAFQTDKPLAEYGQLARQCEAYGFDGISVYNDMLFQPAWLPLMEIARNTSHTRIGVAAVNPFTCHPINIAGNMALITAAAPGRSYLGMARGGWLDFVGVEPQKPVQALREAFICIRHLLAGSSEPLEQEIFPLAGGASLRWQLPAEKLSMLLGSWGLKTIAQCGPHVDEVKLGGSVNPNVVRHYSERLAEADVRADIVMGAVTVVDEDRSAAIALAKREVALYLPVVAELDTTLELDPIQLQGIKEAADRFDFDAACGFISDEMMSAFAMAGTPADIVEQTQALFDAGAARVEFGTPHGLSSERGLKLLGEKVLPAFA